MSKTIQLERFYQGQVHEAAGRWARAEAAYREAGAKRAQARIARRRAAEALLRAAAADFGAPVDG